MFFRSVPLPRTLDAFFLWLSGIAAERDVVSVECSGKKRFFYFDFPLRLGSKPRRITAPPADREITFVVRSPRSAGLPAESEWAAIFSSPELEIFENRNRIPEARENSPAPLRWGLTEEEKKIALKIARDGLEKFLIDGQKLEHAHFGELPRRFYLKCGLDAAIWVKGQLRGSAVVEDFTIGAGIAEAAILASRDSRFKPLSKEELEAARIEITLMQEPHLPLTSLELRKNIIYPDKGYLLEHNPVHRYSNVLKNIGITGNEMRNKEKRGWFLPEVFNARRFSGLEEFLRNLAKEKAGLSPEESKKSELFIFEVDDFIESENQGEVISLWGPIVKSSANNEFVANKRSRPSALTLSTQSRAGTFKLNSSFVDERLRAAADWLCRIQENDGNMPPIINPLTGKQNQIDWPRLAFTAWALSEFGKAANEKRYLEAAEKTCNYLQIYLLPSAPQFESFSRRIPGNKLTLAYFTKLAFSLGKQKDALRAAEKIFEDKENLPSEPILRSQVAGIFKKLAGTKPNFLKYFQDIASLLKENFEEELKSGRPMNLAAWAELVDVFSDFDDECSSKVAEWLKKQQLPSGAFPESTTSDFIYARGTGKIFEVLALEPEKNEEVIAKALDWLFSMQYDEENTFFVPEEIRSRVIGGFRHDYFNQEAWIDAAGHILLGGARLIKK